MRTSPLWVAIATIAVSASFAAAQDAPALVGTTPIERAATVRCVLTGRVLLPGRAPAAGAVVVTSAGGQAAVHEDGRFTLFADAPRDAESVQVTAVASGNLTVSARIALSPHAQSTDVGTLVLAATTSCAPSWLPTFGPAPGIQGSVIALAVYDDGSGPALFAGGQFTSASGVPAMNIAKWDGASWSPLGSGVDMATLYPIEALAVYDDGTGPALYAGGTFTVAGGAPASNIAKWDGASWSPLGSGTNGAVIALTVFDDGTGPALCAGGFFSIAGGAPASNIAKWDGASWSQLGTGTDQGIRALAVYDDGSGPALFAGGHFTVAGGVASKSIARWDGATWSALGSGTSRAVLALAVHDDGSGPALFVGGAFATAGGIAASNIAKWNGASWSALGSGTNKDVWSLTVYDDGSGAALYANGSFSVAGGATAHGIARWNGAMWSPVGGGIIGSSLARTALAVYDDGSGMALFAGGTPRTNAGNVKIGIARWDGAAWSALGLGLSGEVSVLAVFDDGTGPALYASGSGFAGGFAVPGIAKWNGASWSPLGSGIAGQVGALAVHDDGGGAALYAGGSFTTAGGVAVSNIAKWNGVSWSPAGSGPGFTVASLAVYDDGTGAALFAGSGSGLVHGIAKWDGASWTTVASLGGSAVDSVPALTVYDDGRGPALYAGGQFSTVNGVAANNIARWDGASWSPLGAGVNRWVNALAVYDGGGSFDTQLIWLGPTAPPPCPPIGLSASNALALTIQP